MALHRARTKQHLIVLEANYILLYSPSLFKQNPKNSLNLFGDISCLTQSGFYFFSSLPLIFTPPLSNLICIVFKRLLKAVAWQITDEEALVISINSTYCNLLNLHMSLSICLFKFTCTNNIYIYIYIYIWR